MSSNPFVNALQQNRYLRTPSEVASFETALAELVRLRKKEDLADLFRVFTDDCEQHEIMWGLLHFVESFGMADELEALLEVVPVLSKEAPEWVETIHCRILNDANYRNYYKRLFQNASPGARAGIREVLQKIQTEDSDFAPRVSELLE